MTDTMTAPRQSVVESRLAPFERFEAEDATRQPSWLFPARKAGLARFAELGFPTVKDEDWRFTNLAPLTQLPFHPTLNRPESEPLQGDLTHLPLHRVAGPRYVFVNGHYSESLSQPATPVEGADIRPLSAALRDNVPLLEKHLNRYTSAEDDAVAALNTAYFTDGIYIHVKRGHKVTEPVQVLFLSTLDQAGTAIHPRNLIVAEANSEVTLVESYYHLSDGAYLTNSASEFVVDENAKVEHIKVQDESLNAYHLSTLHADLGRSCRFHSHSLALGAKLSRNNLRTRLGGEGISCVLNGLYLTKGEQLADHHMIVNHASPRCESHEYFNGILDDRSRGVFHGRILVQQIAQKTDAKQTNKNLLLSDDATVNTKPQLEIYADDVKCTHGATIGQMNEEAIFYLRARGIGESFARRMLMHSFAGEIIDRIECEPIREELDQIVWDRLESNPHIAELT